MDLMDVLNGKYEYRHTKNIKALGFKEYNGYDKGFTIVNFEHTEYDFLGTLQISLYLEDEVWKRHGGIIELEDDSPCTSFNELQENAITEEIIDYIQSEECIYE